MYMYIIVYAFAYVYVYVLFAFVLFCLSSFVLSPCACACICKLPVHAVRNEESTFEDDDLDLSQNDVTLLSPEQLNAVVKRMAGSRRRPSRRPPRDDRRPPRDDAKRWPRMCPKCGDSHPELKCLKQRPPGGTESAGRAGKLVTPPVIVRARRQATPKL